MATNDSTSKKKTKSVSKERQFKGLSLSERKEARREKLIEATAYPGEVLETNPSMMNLHAAFMNFIHN